jgi:hypothetical protein
MEDLQIYRARFGGCSQLQIAAIRVGERRSNRKWRTRATRRLPVSILVATG